MSTWSGSLRKAAFRVPSVSTQGKAGGYVMLEIVKDGIIETDDLLMELTKQYGQVVIPNGDEELNLTHWWVIRDDGVEMLYVGTLETFTTYIEERNGGVQ
jgi:hypothetical protein